MTKLERDELQAQLDEYNAAISDYEDAIQGITNSRAVALLIDALAIESQKAGAIRYQLQQAEEV